MCFQKWPFMANSYSVLPLSLSILKQTSKETSKHANTQPSVTSDSKWNPVYSLRMQLLSSPLKSRVHMVLHPTCGGAHSSLLFLTTDVLPPVITRGTLEAHIIHLLIFLNSPCLTLQLFWSFHPKTKSDPCPCGHVDNPSNNLISFLVPWLSVLFTRTVPNFQ